MKFNFLFFFILIFAVADIKAEIRSAYITNYSIEQINEKEIEIKLQAQYCLKNSKIIAIIETRNGLRDSYEIERIYYDIETLEAVFSGIFPYKKNEVKIKFKISNFDDSSLIPDDNIIETMKRKQEEISFNKADKEVSESIDAIKKKEEEKEAETESHAAETAVGVVILLPMLLEGSGKNDDDMDEF